MAAGAGVYRARLYMVWGVHRTATRFLEGSTLMTTSAIETKVKSIIADQLGVGEDEIKPSLRSSRTWAPTASTSSSW